MTSDIAATVAEAWIEADEFYRVLREWRDSFEAEWAAQFNLEKKSPG